MFLRTVLPDSVRVDDRFAHVRLEQGQMVSTTG